MIRYTSSFTISLLLHIFLAIILFYGYININIPSTKQEIKVKLNLSYLIEEKPQIVPIKKIISQKVNPLGKPKKKESPKKKVSPKKVKKVIKKKKIIKKTPIVKIEIKKILPKINPLVEPVKEIIKYVKPIDKAPIKKIKTIPIESIEDKERRLQTQYIANNIDKIVKLLKENLYYPRSARKRGIVGEVIVKFKLSIDSQVRFIDIISSQNEILSRAAIQTIQELSGSFPKPTEELTIQIPIKYNLQR